MAKARRRAKRKSHKGMAVGKCKPVRGKKGIKLCRIKGTGKGQYRFKRAK